MEDKEWKDYVKESFININGKLEKIEVQVTKSNGRINMLEYKTDNCAIHEVKEICGQIPNILNEIKIMRLEQQRIIENYIATNTSLNSVKVETEVIRFFSKYPKITMFILGLITSLAAMGGFGAIIKLL